MASVFDRKFLLRKSLILATLEQWETIDAQSEGGVIYVSPKEVFEEIGLIGSKSAKTDKTEKKFFKRLYQYAGEAEKING